MKLVPGKLYRTQGSFSVYSGVDKGVSWLAYCQSEQFHMVKLPEKSLCMFIEEFETNLDQINDRDPHPSYQVYRFLDPMGRRLELVTDSSQPSSYYFMSVKEKELP